MLFKRFRAFASGYIDFNKRLSEQTANEIYEKLKVSKIWSKLLNPPSQKDVEERKEWFLKTFTPFLEKTVMNFVSIGMWKAMQNDPKLQEEFIEKNVNRYVKNLDTSKAYKFYEKALKKLKKKQK